MRSQLRQFTFLALIPLLLTLASSATAQVRPYRVTDRQVESLVSRVETRTNSFKLEVDRSLDRSAVDGTNREDSINTMIANFETATDNLRNNFSSRRSTAADVQGVLDRAVRVNTFMTNNRVSTSAQTQWNLIRGDLETLAGYYNVRTDWTARTTFPGDRGGGFGGGAQTRALLDSLKLRADAFKTSFDRWASFNRRNASYSTSNIAQEVTDFQRELGDLNRRTLSNRNSTDNPELEQVLKPASAINSFIGSNRTNAEVTSRWNLVKSDLNALSTQYRVSWDWDNTSSPTGPIGGFDGRLTGSYRLNASLSDNVTTVVDRAILAANYGANQQDRMKRNLERRLVSPETLSLEKRGQQITLSSAGSASVALTADGTSRTETSPNGRTVRTSVTATARDLTINYEGDRMNDYFVTFTPVGNDRLRVARRVYLENQNQTVTVTSVYDKTSPTPDWNLTAQTGGTSSSFAIPNNTSVTATLDSVLSTRTAKDGDRFTMTVTSPSQYSGAVIEGSVVGERSGVFSGRANMQLSFETIRLRNGQTYRFAGIVDQVRQPDGSVVSVNNEGSVRDGSQTNRTVTRAGIGGALGAIIGAIAGGGKGAAIGAAVGAGAGAGTVVLQGRDNLELQGGTQFTITATAPASTVGIR